MSAKERQEFLTGLYATWMAAERGREKPLAKDKKDAAAAAASSVEFFNYRLTFGAPRSDAKAA